MPLENPTSLDRARWRLGRTIANLQHPLRRLDAQIERLGGLTAEDLETIASVVMRLEGLANQVEDEIDRVADGLIRMRAYK
jgi:hypothetical protein